MEVYAPADLKVDRYKDGSWAISTPLGDRDLFRIIATNPPMARGTSRRRLRMTLRRLTVDRDQAHRNMQRWDAVTFVALATYILLLLLPLDSAPIMVVRLVLMGVGLGAAGRGCFWGGWYRALGGERP